MKHTLIYLLLISFSALAQPQVINYQGVARDSVGHPILNQNISLRLSILNGSATGLSVYVETQNVLTSGSGLFNVSIGMGIVVSGVFANINWGQANKFLMIEMDASGGNNFQLIGVTQFLSVPYAIYSANGSLWNNNGLDISNTNPGNIGVGINPPNLKAILELNSNSKGFLPPRMSEFEKNAISNPPLGLIVYCINCGINGGELEVFNGASWRNMAGDPASISPNLVIGQYYMGGIIAYLLQPGDNGYDPNIVHGLITAMEIEPQHQWGCLGTNILGADGVAIGTGNQNTIDIINGCITPNIAARYCRDLILNGYNDWYLPSKEELSKLWVNRNAIGGFTNQIYWSSTEYSANYAWSFDFSTGTPKTNQLKSTINVFRVIRKF